MLLKIYWSPPVPPPLSKPINSHLSGILDPGPGGEDYPPVDDVPGGLMGPFRLGSRRRGGFHDSHRLEAGD